MSTPTQRTMQAIVFKGPKKIAVEERPIPEIQDPGDVVCKVEYAGLCGSELHVYRGIEKKDTTGFIMGHEFVGTVVQAGSAVTSVEVGDKVVTPFTISWYAKICATFGAIGGRGRGFARRLLIVSQPKPTAGNVSTARMDSHLVARNADFLALRCWRGLRLST
ncbi:hypothetical protein ABW19_dt0205165 [Dactylella cylindrospora]|nr:hypothetical protein ABW19_dt0205165 [Dactylella cylindrospora]